MHPDCAAVEQMRLLATQRPRELMRARGVIAGEVDDGAGFEACDAFTECAGCFFRVTIEMAIGNGTPCAMLAIGPVLAAADADHFMAFVNEHGCEIAANVTRSANYDYAHSEGPFLLSMPRSRRGKRVRGAFDTANFANL